MKFVMLEFENGEERLSWGNLGESSRPPERQHNLETEVEKAQAERRKLKVLAEKKRGGFKQHRQHLAQHKAATPAMVKVAEYTTPDGVRYTIWQ